MDKTASYVKYGSHQISNLKENLLSDKIFLFLKKSNFNKKEEKNKRLKNTLLLLIDFF